MNEPQEQGDDLNYCEVGASGLPGGLDNRNEFKSQSAAGIGCVSQFRSAPHRAHELAVRRVSE